MFAKVLNTIWMWQTRGTAREFRRATGELRATQERLLFETLRANADSAYGRKHAFERIGTLDEFQRRVPMSDYDALRPSIEAIAHGASVRGGRDGTSAKADENCVRRAGGTGWTVPRAKSGMSFERTDPNA